MTLCSLKWQLKEVEGGWKVGVNLFFRQSRVQKIFFENLPSEGWEIGSGITGVGVVEGGVEGAERKCSRKINTYFWYTK